MTDIIVNASTSLVNINTSNITLGSNAVVLLSSVNSPGAIITIRDYIGFASTNRKVIISTTSDTQFLDGPQISSFEITTPYGFFTVSPKTSSIWTVVNSFAFGTQANATVSSLTVTGQIVSDRILNASTFSTSHMQTSSATVTSYLYASSIGSEIILASTLSTSFLHASTIASKNANISTISSVLQNTSSLIITGQASTTIINTSSLFVNGTNVYLATSTSLTTSALFVSSIAPSTAGTNISFTTGIQAPCTITSTLAVSSIIPQVSGEPVTLAGVLRPSTIAINQTSAIAPLDILGPNTAFTAVTENGGNCIQFATGKATGNQTLVMGNSSTISTSYIQAIRVNTFGSALSLNPRGGNVFLGSSAEGGRVGIRTAIPSTTLHVIGNETVGSNANAIAFFQAAATLNTNDAGVLIGSVNGNTPYLSDNDSTASAGLTFRTANTERMRIARTTGNVGIGTSNPAGTLDVNGTLFLGNTSSNTGILRFTTFGNETFIQSGTSNTSGSATKLYFTTINASSTLMTLDMPNQRVGIGTSSPTTRLQVHGAILNTLCNTGTTTNDANLIVRNALDSDSHKIQFFTALNAGGYNNLTGTNDKAIIVTDGSLETGNLVIGPHSGSAFGIKVMSNGRVGIGIASPTYTLDVNGSFRCLDTVVVKNGSNLSSWAFNCITSGDTLQAMIFGYGNSTNNAGNVSFSYVGAGSSSNRLNLGFFNNDNVMNLTAAGYVGIGTTSPSYPLHITRTVSEFVGPYGYLNLSGAAGNFPGQSHNISIYTTGVQVGTEHLALSDEREKENIHSYSNALHVVEKLHPVTYTWKDSLVKGKRYNYGFVAQEIHEMFPELITKTTDYIPNLYIHSKQSTINQSTLLFFTSTLQTNLSTIQTPSKIKLFDEKGNQEENYFLALTSSYVHISSPLTLSTPYTFVYGTEVDDHMALNYNGIFTITTAALKELHTKVNEQSTIIQTLLTQLSTQQAELQDIKCMLKKS